MTSETEEPLFEYESGPERAVLSVYADPDGLAVLYIDTLGNIRSSGELGEHAAKIPASQIARLCRALYAAVGDEMPDLRAAVSSHDADQLSAVIVEHLEQDGYRLGHSTRLGLARHILARGYSQDPEHGA